MSKHARRRPVPALLARVAAAMLVAAGLFWAYQGPTRPGDVGVEDVAVPETTPDLGEESPQESRPEKRDTDKSGGGKSGPSKSGPKSGSDKTGPRRSGGKKAAGQRSRQPSPQRVPRAAKKLADKVENVRHGLADETTFRVASFNVLGHSHTVPGGNRPGWAPSQTRMGWAVNLLRNADVDVVGFQEFEPSQYRAFRRLTGGSFEIFPGHTLDRGSVRDSIAWRTDSWQRVEAHSIATPYFGGQEIRRPYVKLRSRQSGREVWFFNTHNPADVRGSASRWRAVATDRQVALANRLGRDGTPVVFTGDYNDRALVFCKFVTRTRLVAANGGSASRAGCRPPAAMGVNWIFGSDVAFTSFRAIRDGVVGRASDHPLLVAQAHVPEEPLPSP